MEILDYLAELIQHRNQVGIAGLGTLYKSKIPGRYDAEAHAFLPPAYVLKFDTELLEKDALAAYIGSKRNIPAESALALIEQYSEKAVQELSETNETQLGSLGKLSSVNGFIVFEPDENGLSAIEYFGLPKLDERELRTLQEPLPIKIEQVEDDFVEEGDEETASAYTSPAPEEPTEPEKLPEQQEFPATEELPAAEELPEPEELRETESSPATGKIEEIIEENRIEEENPGIESQELAALLPTETGYAESNEPQEEAEEKKTPYLTIVLVSLLLLGVLSLAFFLYPKMMTENKEELQKSVLADSIAHERALHRSDSIAHSDSIQHAAVAPDTLVADSTAATVPVVPPATEQPQVPTYEVVIGSLANRKEAEKFIAQIKRKGINGWMVESQTGSKIRVSVASFTDRETANKERGRIAKELKDPSIYIYTNKPKK